MTDNLTANVTRTIKSLSNVHHPDGQPNVFLFSLPRSGSTWLMELIWSQPGFKCCDEPTDLRHALIQQHLGKNWETLYDDHGTALIEAYFQGFCSGRHKFMNPSPLRKNYRPYTQRIVFKIIHGCEDRINWFRDTFNGRILYLTRHPIAVSLSREYLPTLPALLHSDYRRHFTPAQLAYAEHINEHGDKLERGVLSWCLQTAVPLAEATEDWTFVSYEQMVVDPHTAVHHIAHKLDLPAPDRMVRQLSVPSGSSHKSDQVTQQALDAGAKDQRNWLVEKWRERVTDDEEHRLMEILDRFGIDIYRYGEVLPSDFVWIPPAPRTVSEAEEPRLNVAR